MEWLGHIDKALGIAGVIITMLLGVVTWAHRRAEKRDAALKKDLHEDNLKDRTRLGRVEGDVKRLSADLDEMKGEVRERFADVDKRFHEIDLALKDVAKRDDLLGIMKSQAAMDSRLETLLESDRRLTGMIHQQGEAFGKLAAQIYERVKK